MIYFIWLLLMALPFAALILFAYTLKRFIRASKAERKTLRFILPLIISAIPAGFAVFIIGFIIGIFTGAIPLM